MKKEALIAIPVFNEAPSLPGLLESLQPFRDRLLFINDGSEDISAEIIQDAGFQCVDFPSNLGLSAVYRAVFSYADRHQYERFIMMDGDGQHDPRYITSFEDLLTKHELVCGSRFSNTINVPSEKIAANLFAVLLVYRVTGKWIPDAACGFRGLFRGSAWPFLSGSFSFEVIYSTLIDALLKQKSVGFVSMTAIYPNQEFFFTRKTELWALLRAAMRECTDPWIKDLKRQLISNQVIEFDLDDFHFRVQSHNNDYIFQTNNTEARKFFHEINHKVANEETK